MADLPEYDEAGLLTVTFGYFGSFSCITAPKLPREERLLMKHPVFRFGPYIWTPEISLRIWQGPNSGIVQLLMHRPTRVLNM